MKATATSALTHSEALEVLESAIAYLSLRGARKQSGTHARVVMPAESTPPGKKIVGD